MRIARVLGPESTSSCYHVMARVIEGRMIFDDIAKEKFRTLLDVHCRFAQIRLITFCIMGNHWHALIEVPDPEKNPLIKAPDSEFLDHLEILYPQEAVQEIATQLEDFRDSGMDTQAEQLRLRYLVRMRDLSVFVKELQQRFTQWHNRRTNRRGPLWQDRFKSVLVEGSGSALKTMAAYIDLNPVRAGLVSDPKDYRWSGYGEAVAGRARAREGLMRLVSDQYQGHPDMEYWVEVQRTYRCWLYGDGRERRDDEGRVIKHGFSAEDSDAVIEREEGALAWSVLAKMRVRYFSDGVALGSRAFVEEVFRARRARFGVKRLDGARRMRGVNWGGLMNMRDLRGKV